MFFECNTNNKTETVLNAFLQAVDEHGLPSRVRGDMGVANVDVAKFMFSHPERGPDRGNFVTGKSSHNQRTERLWVDVYLGVVYIYYCAFIYLETEQLLHPDDEIEMFCLHFVYQRGINEHLQQFVEGWNCHKLSSVGNFTPNQLWIMGIHDIANCDSCVAKEIWEPLSDVSM